jgi:protein TonB
VSVAAHALAVGAVVILPVFSEEELPETAGEARAFFATPLDVAPPPPPPPPPPPAGRVAPPAEPPRPTRIDEFVAPVEVPAEVAPERGLELGLEGGVAGGVEGGVPGGVVGGIVGGLADAPPPRREPVRVGGSIKEPRKFKDVAPVYPPLAIQGRVEGVVVLECVVDVQGRVQEVRVLRGVPLLDEAALAAVRQWVYTPTLVNGVPVPVVMTVTVTFRLR